MRRRSDPRVVGPSSNPNRPTGLLSCRCQPAFIQRADCQRIASGDSRVGPYSTNRGRPFPHIEKEVMCNRHRRRPREGRLVHAGPIPNRGEPAVPGHRQRRFSPVGDRSGVDQPALAGLRGWRLNITSLSSGRKGSSAVCETWAYSRIAARDPLAIGSMDKLRLAPAGKQTGRSVAVGRWTGDPRVGALSHGPGGADAPFRFTAREGGPSVPLCPQWPRRISNRCVQYRNASLSRH